MPEYELQDKIAIVTGGGTGIGKRIAMACARAGANVVVASRNKENLDGVAGDIKALGRESLAVATDVCVCAQVENMVAETMDKFGRIDILVNNAGAAITFTQVENLTDEEWHATVSLNLTAPFFCSRAVGKIMIKQQSGKIVNISSGAGMGGVSFMAHYAAAKAGVINLTESLASGWARYNINVNCIAPGLTSSEVELARGSFPSKTRPDATPVPRLLYPPAPEDVADLALFLVSPASDHITGELIPIRALGR